MTDLIANLFILHPPYLVHLVSLSNKNIRKYFNVLYSVLIGVWKSLSWCVDLGTCRLNKPNLVNTNDWVILQWVMHTCSLLFAYVACYCSDCRNIYLLFMPLSYYRVKALELCVLLWRLSMFHRTAHGHVFSSDSTA